MLLFQLAHGLFILFVFIFSNNSYLKTVCDRGDNKITIQIFLTVSYTLKFSESRNPVNKTLILTTIVNKITETKVTCKNTKLGTTVVTNS